MPDLNIIAKKRHENFSRVLERLEMDAVIPSTKSDPLVREAFIAELLLAVVERSVKKPRKKPANK